LIEQFSRPMFERQTVMLTARVKYFTVGRGIQTKTQFKTPFILKLVTHFVLFS